MMGIPPKVVGYADWTKEVCADCFRFLHHQHGEKESDVRYLAACPINIHVLLTRPNRLEPNSGCKAQLHGRWDAATLHPPK